MICPIQITYSLMCGAVLAYGIMWPLIERKQGEWFPDGKNYGVTGNNVAGLNGYKVGPSCTLLMSGFATEISLTICMLKAFEQSSQMMLGYLILPTAYKPINTGTFEILFFPGTYTFHVCHNLANLS